MVSKGGQADIFLLSFSVLHFFLFNTPLLFFFIHIYYLLGRVGLIRLCATYHCVYFYGRGEAERRGGVIFFLFLGVALEVFIYYALHGVECGWC